MVGLQNWGLTYQRKAGDRQMVAFVSSSVKMHVVDCLVTYKATQTYRNTKVIPVDCTYRMPVESGLVVTSFTVTFGSTVVRAKVDEAKAAAATYRAAVKAGKSAALGAKDEQTDDVFVIKVGNIPSHTTAVVEITMTVPARLERQGCTRLLFPAFLAPRFSGGKKGPVLSVPAPRPIRHTKPKHSAPRKSAAGGDTAGAGAVAGAGGGGSAPVPSVNFEEAVIDASAVAPHSVKVQLTVDMPLPITSVVSPSHPACAFPRMHGCRRRRTCLPARYHLSSGRIDVNNPYRFTSFLPGISDGIGSDLVLLVETELSPCRVWVEHFSQRDDIGESVPDGAAPIPPTPSGPIAPHDGPLSAPIDFPSHPLPNSSVLPSSIPSEPPRCPVRPLVSSDTPVPKKSAAATRASRRSGASAGAGAGADAGPDGAPDGAPNSAHDVAPDVAPDGPPDTSPTVLPSEATEPAAPGSVAVMAVLSPDLSRMEILNDSLNEVIFVVDRSGSMDRENRIGSARNALQLCLRSLPQGSRFNIYGFGNRFYKLFPDGSVPYSDETLATATAHIGSMSADMGGTEILSPLIDIASIPPHDNHPRQIILLTDGQVRDTNAVVRFAGEQYRSTSTRVFTFGIGSGVSTALVAGVANASYASHELIAHGEDMEDKVMRLLLRAMQPNLTNLRMDWGELTPHLAHPAAPLKRQPVYQGGQSLMYGVLKPSALQELGGTVCTIKLSVDSPDGELFWPVRFVVPGVDSVPTTAVTSSSTAGEPDTTEPASSAPSSTKLVSAEVKNRNAPVEVLVTTGRTIHAAAAYARVRDLETLAAEEPAAAPAAKAEAVALGLKYSIASKWTSFVAVVENASTRAPTDFSLADYNRAPPPEPTASSVPASAAGSGSGPGSGALFHRNRQARHRASHRCSPRGPGPLMKSSSAAVHLPPPAPSFSLPKSALVPPLSSGGGGGAAGAAGAAAAGAAPRSIPVTNSRRKGSRSTHSSMAQSRMRRDHLAEYESLEAEEKEELSSDSDDADHDVDFSDAAAGASVSVGLDDDLRSLTALAQEMDSALSVQSQVVSALDLEKKKKTKTNWASKSLHPAPAAMSPASSVPASSPGSSLDDRVRHLVLMQSADGHWSPSPQLQAILGLADFTASKPESVSEDTWATVLALVWLEKAGVADSVKYTNIVRKAKRFVASNLPASCSMETVRGAAETAIGTVA